jgi:peptidoglycan-associated lipoprotein
MELGNYAAAREVLDEAYDEREDPELIPILAEANMKLRDYRMAESWYRRLLRRDRENAYAELHYDYAEALKMQGKYDDAIQEYQQYLALGSDPAKKQMAQLALTGAELALSMSESTKGVSVEALDRRTINTRTSEYSPALSPGGRVLYYSSSETEDVIVVDDKNDPKKFFLIFQSELQEKENRDGTTTVEFSKPEPLGPEINRPEYHSTNVSLSPDGRRMYFNRIKLGEGNVIQESKIYLSEGGDGGWKSANEVAGVNGDYLAIQPIVGELYGNEVLFFVSDMEGGEGGRDIYYATYQGDGVYGDPVNLGPSINTPGNEEGPFWFDGTLYFSSDGYPSLGGLDFFYSVWDGSNWSEPVNMGKAYNTPADEKYFRLFDDGYQGFFTSNRPEGRSIGGKTCCDDIYGFTIARRYVNLQVGTFNENRKPLKGATVMLIDETLTEAGEEGAEQSQSRQNSNVFEYNLDFNHEYTIIATHPDYYPDTVTMNTLGQEETKTYVERIFLDPKPKLPDSVTVTIDQAIVMENILYDFDDDKITESAEIDLQTIYELMTDYPEMKIELGSHTDARGIDNYNMDLSQRRAESARRWLMRKGITRERIVAQGYGETKPKLIDSLLAQKFEFLAVGDILTEDFIKALPTEEQQEEAHQLNRRTEFKIIEGPTSIRMKITRPATQEDKDRGSRIGNGRAQVDPPVVDRLSSLYGQTDLKGVPIMQFKERRYALGAVKKGEQRSFTYTFVNRGDTELVIDLISACDCTSTNQDELIGKVYKPGQGDTIKVTFDSADKDEAETIDIDIYLRNNDKQGNPIMEMLQYSFEIE